MQAFLIDMLDFQQQQKAVLAVAEESSIYLISFCSNLLNAQQSGGENLFLPIPHLSQSTISLGGSDVLNLHTTHAMKFTSSVVVLTAKKHEIK